MGTDELPPWHYSGDGSSVSITAPDNSLVLVSQYTDASLSGTFGYSRDGARAGVLFGVRPFVAALYLFFYGA